MKTTRSVRVLFVSVLCAIFVGCGGGGGNSGESLFNVNQGCSSSACAASAATSIDVLASSVQVGSGGDTVTISAIVKGAGNVSLADAPVTFSVDSGILTGASTSTDDAGVATATFAPGSDRTNRTATVTVSSGSVAGTLALQIVGTTLSYSGVTTVPLNGKATLGVTARDSKGAFIPNAAIAVSSGLNNGLSATSVTTNSQGGANVDYTAVNAGNDALTFTGAGSSLSQALQVSAEDFAFVSPAAGTQIPVATPQQFVVRYRVNNAAQVGKTINFAATAGTVTPTSAVTDASGQASVSVSSTTASPATVQASVAGASAQATLPIVFVAQSPAKLVLQVSPTAIGPNPAGATAQQAQLLATVTDINGNPVSGSTVTFNRIADPSAGNLSQASAVTDSSGQASVQYIAGALTTANNGVQVQATVQGAPSVSGVVQLTVNQSALFIALGTGNTITNLDPQTYKKDWVVYVTDSNGVAVPNINLTIKVLPTDYRKGNLIFQGGSWSYESANLHVCANEDANYNGVLDTSPFEDFNGNGRLEPGNVISVTTAETTTAASTGIARTDATGRATLTLLYAESYVPWVKVKLVVQAIVSGTESSTEANFVVVGLASDFNSATNPPAAVVSPFGVNDCSIPD